MTVELYLQAGERLAKAGKIAEAILEYEKALTLPGQKPASLYEQLGDAYQQNGQLESAKIAYEQAIELNPTNPWFYVKMAGVSLEAGNAFGALAAYKKAIELQPDNPHFYFYLANFYFRRDEVEEALATYHQGLEKNRDNLQVTAAIYKELAKVAWLKLGSLEQEDIADAKAIVIYSQLLQANPKDILALFGLVEIYHRRQEFDQALSYCQRLVEIQPENSLAYIRRAEVMLDQGDIEGAMTAYQQALHTKPDQPLAWYKKYARLLKGNTKAKQAISIYQKLLESNPPTHIAAFIYKKLGETYQQHLLGKSGGFARAEVAFEKAKEKYSQVNGLAVGEMKQLTEEIAEINSLMLVPYRYAIRRNPDNSSLHKELADAAVKYERWDEAVAAYRYALELDPSQTELSASLEKAIAQQRKCYEPEKAFSSARRSARELGAVNNLVICIITCEKYQHKQQAIRNTWLKEVIKRNIPYFFVIGKPSSQSYVEGDILYVDAPDTYEHLPRKTYKLIQFIHNCTGYSHLFKVDDDCYVSIDNLLNCGFQFHDYMGKVVKNIGNLKDWHIGKTSDPAIGKYTGEFRGSFAGGGYGYFLSRYAMSKIVAYFNQKYLNSELYEDKLVADILREYNIYPICSERYLVGAEFANKRTDYQLALSPFRETPYPHKNNEVVTFHSDAAPERLEQIHQNYSDDNYENRTFLRNPFWWEEGNDKVCLERMDHKEIKLGLKDVLCFVVVRNEALRLPYFLKYYRSKGIENFFIVDNHSTDNTLPYLLQQPDVYLWHTTRSFSAASGGLDWMELLLKTYGLNHWCLTLDADEFLFYLDAETKSIPQLCRELEREKKQAFSAVLLDMYSQKPLKDAKYTPGQNPLEVCPYFDQPFYTVKKMDIDGRMGYWGGVRERVFPLRKRMNLLHKVPLVKYDFHAKLYHRQHQIDNLDVAQQTGCLFHFKYFSDFHELAKLESARGEDALDSLKYKRFAIKLDKNPELSMYSPEKSVKFKDGQQLWELGIIQGKSNNLKDSQCVFVIAQVRSGSTLLMRLLNSIEGYNICGENNGALIELHKFYQQLVYTIVQGKTVKKNTENQLGADNRFLTYEELLAKREPNQNFTGVEWYNVFAFQAIQEKLRELIAAMFNPEGSYQVWGCKEIRYGKSSYEEFENELNFLKELLPLTKFIFNTRNIEDTVKSAWWAEDPETSRKILETQYQYYLMYQSKYPEFTYHITYENLVNNTEHLHGMYHFLGEEFESDKYQEVLAGQSSP